MSGVRGHAIGARVSPRRGAALLEALIALLVLSIAVLAVARISAAAANAVQRAQQVDTDLYKANAFFHALSLWSRDDLDRHLGRHPEGAWQLSVQRRSPNVYDIELFDAASAQSEGSGARRLLLATSLYRPR